MERNALLDEYKALYLLTDNRIKELERRLATFINCRPGCHACCTLGSVLPLEALVIEKALSCLRARQQARVRRQAFAPSPNCPLLLDGLCAIYENRPLICRSHGLPIAYIDFDRQTIEVSACPKNFPTDFDIGEADLLFMDEVNRRLHRLNDKLPLKKKMLRQSIVDIINATDQTSSVEQL